VDFPTGESRFLPGNNVRLTFVLPKTNEIISTEKSSSPQDSKYSYIGTTEINESPRSLPFSIEQKQ
jgi:hypothetical protein